MKIALYRDLFRAVSISAASQQAAIALQFILLIISDTQFSDVFKGLQSKTLKNC